MEETGQVQTTWNVTLVGELEGATVAVLGVAMLEVVGVTDIFTPYLHNRARWKLALCTVQRIMAQKSSRISITDGVSRQMCAE